MKNLIMSILFALLLVAIVFGTLVECKFMMDFGG